MTLPSCKAGSRRDILVNIAQLCHQEEYTATLCSLTFTVGGTVQQTTKHSLKGQCWTIASKANNEYNAFSFNHKSTLHCELLQNRHGYNDFHNLFKNRRLMWMLGWEMGTERQYFLSLTCNYSADHWRGWGNSIMISVSVCQAAV